MPARRRGQSREEGRVIRFPSDRVFAGRAWVRGRLQPVELGIDGDGRIERLGRNVPGSERRDFGDAIFLPSATDVHVHIREPGPDARLEGFRSGTEQAALGGVGLVGVMPNTEPAIDRLDRLETRAARASGQLAVDALLFALAARPEQVAAMAHRAGAFKMYESPTSGIESAPAAASQQQIMSAVARTGLALSVHAEDPAKFAAVDSVRTTADWNRQRPPEAEESAVDATLAAPPALRLHFAHITLPSAAQRIREAGVSSEATAHHLLLSADSNGDPWTKVNPPLRSPSTRDGLWEAFARGEIPLLASDHAPHTNESKGLGFDRAPSGMPGLETTLPLMLAEVRDGRLALPTLQTAACDRPARWAGVPQGRLAPRHRANLIVVDFRKRESIEGRRLHPPMEHSPFEGRTAIFPLHHFLDGMDLVNDRSFVGGYAGRVLRPEYAPLERASARRTD